MTSVGYLTSGQYYGTLLHFFQTKENGGPGLIDPNDGSISIPSQKRIFAIVDIKFDTSKFQQELHVTTNRCVMMSRVEVVKFERDADARATKAALGIATEFDVLAQGATMLDFVRIVCGAFSLNNKGPKMVLLALSDYQAQPGREVYVVPATSPVAPTPYDVSILQDKVNALLDERAKSKEAHLGEMVSMHTQLEATRRHAEDVERMLAATRSSSLRTEDDLKREIFRLEALLQGQSRQGALLRSPATPPSFHTASPPRYGQQQQHQETVPFILSPLPFEKRYNEILELRRAEDLRRAGGPTPHLRPSYLQ